MRRARFSRRFIWSYRLVFLVIYGSLDWFFFSHKDYVPGFIATAALAICLSITLTWKRK